MNKYIAEFKGREVGAIGIFYRITTDVYGKNKKQAKLNLYDRYEHIQQLKLTKVFDYE